MKSERIPIRLKRITATRQWKKFLVCGCSHGKLADRTALDAVLKFKDGFKPSKTIHLGDAFDTAAFRSGAKGGADEVESVEDDMMAGCSFIDKLRPDLFFIGNHEYRWYKDAKRPNALISHAATKTIRELRDFMAEIGCEFVEDYHWDAWRMLGSYKVGHGISFNENAVRDHAERAGNCIIAHLHRQEVAHGRRLDHPTCVSVGYLGDPNKFGYADLWPGKMKWNAGWLYGEYTEGETKWQLHRHDTPETRSKEYLPV
jgi:hypothetical protein